MPSSFSLLGYKNFLNVFSIFLISSDSFSDSATSLNEKVKDYFYQFTWDELNKPKQKQHIRDAFPELDKFKIKPHLNLQLASGIDKVFEGLLNNNKINFRNRKRVMDMCRDWSKGVLNV